MASSNWWERSLVLGGWAVAGLLALGALAGVFRGNGHSETRPPLVVARASPNQTRSSSVEGAAQSRQLTPSRPTAAPGTPAPALTPQPVATRCNQLRDSPNWTADDREWFLAKCLAGGPGRDAPATPWLLPGEGPTGDGEPPATLPTPTAAPVAASSAGSAIGLAVHWLATDAPVAYNADAGSCTAVSLGGPWLTTCRATLAGCSEVGACDRTISLCVHLDPPSVTLSQAC